MNNKYIVTWNDFHLFSRKLASKLHKKDWKGIIAINRNGLILSALLARELNIEIIETLFVSTPENDKETQIETRYKSEEILFVTDIINNENDLNHIQKILNKGHLVSIFVKKEVKNFLYKYILEVPEDIEIVEPWKTIYSYIPPIKDIT